MKNLPQWVVQEKLLTPEQLEEAKKLQAEAGLPLAMALIELKLLEERTPSTSSWEVLRLTKMEERPSLDSLQQERLHGEFTEPIGWVEMP